MDVTFAQSIKPSSSSAAAEEKCFVNQKHAADQDARVPKQRGGEKFALIKTNLFDHPGTESRGRTAAHKFCAFNWMYVRAQTLFIPMKMNVSMRAWCDGGGARGGFVVCADRVASCIF